MFTFDVFEVGIGDITAVDLQEEAAEALAAGETVIISRVVARDCDTTDIVGSLTVLELPTLGKIRFSDDADAVASDHGALLIATMDYLEILEERYLRSWCA